MNTKQVVQKKNGQGKVHAIPNAGSSAVPSGGNYSWLGQTAAKPFPAKSQAQKSDVNNFDAAALDAKRFEQQQGSKAELKDMETEWRTKRDAQWQAEYNVLQDQHNAAVSGINWNDATAASHRPTAITNVSSNSSRLYKNECYS